MKWNALCGMSLFLVACQGQSVRQQGLDPLGVLATGHAEVQVAPDRAILTLGVSQRAATAREAQAQASAVAQRVLAALSRLGVERDQIQTTQLTLAPVFSTPRPESADEPRVVGYRAENLITIESARLEQLGALIDAAVQAGASRLEGVSFTRKDDLAARQQALQAAADRARRQAETLARALGVRLGPVVQVREGAGVLPTPMLRETALLRADAGTPVLPGQVTVAADVTVRYEIQ